MSLPDNIVLIGFMGTGKSAVGRALARHLRMRYLDTDIEIERVADKTIARLFAEEGEAVFRSLETTLLQHLALPTPSESEAGSKPIRLVIATGGGMPLSEENRALLRRIGRVIWLTAPAGHILRRVGPDVSSRPLLAAHREDPLGRIEALLAARAPYYAAAADLAWDTSLHPSPTEAAQNLAHQLCQPAVPTLPGPTEMA